MLTTRGYTWQFKGTIRRHGFGWKSQPAITRVRESEALVGIGALVDHEQPPNRAVDIIRRELNSQLEPPLKD